MLMGGGLEILCECLEALKNWCSKGQGEGVKSGYIKGLMSQAG